MERFARIATGEGEEAVSVMELFAGQFPFAPLFRTFAAILNCFMNAGMQTHDFLCVLSNLFS